MGLHFQGSGLPLSFDGTWSAFMCKIHIALQEIQAVMGNAAGMAFHSSGKVVALHLYNRTAKTYLCNPNGKVSLSFPD